MDLQPQLRTADDHRCSGVAGAGVCGEQEHRFRSGALGILRHSHVSHVFPASATLLATHGLGIGAALYLTFAYCGGLDTASGFKYSLFHVGALAVGERLAFPDECEVALPDGNPGHAGHLFVGLH